MSEELGAAGLRFEREGVVAWCVIDRPQARNAFTPAMYFGIKRAVGIVNEIRTWPRSSSPARVTSSLRAGTSAGVRTRATSPRPTSGTTSSPS